MNIIARLSSSKGDRTEQSNKNAAQLCLSSPELLSDIAEAIDENNVKLTGDCVEVFTLVSQSRPELTVKYVEKIVPLLKSKNTRVRWEAMHTIALITSLIPEIINSLFYDIYNLIINDKSVIVRDYAVKSLSSFAGTDKKSAQRTFPVLIELLNLWKERHGAGIIEGLINIYPFMPEGKKEMLKVVEEYENSERGTVRKITGKLKKLILNDIK